MNKNELEKNKTRNRLIRRRQLLENNSQVHKSAKIVEQVSKGNVIDSAQRIAVYYAVRGEADPSGLTNIVSGTGKQFYLPILAADGNQGLVFAPIDLSTKYKNNKFSIPEPLNNSSDLIDGSDLDLVVMPLLGFDKSGNRLGMGGGFYDRCFAFKKEKQIKPILMGFAYDFQKVDSLTAEPWDVPLDMIATESELILCR